MRPFMMISANSVEVEVQSYSEPMLEVLARHVVRQDVWWRTYLMHSQTRSRGRLKVDAGLIFLVM